MDASYADAGVIDTARDAAKAKKYATCARRRDAAGADLARGDATRV
jgi:hypothetical protein